MVMISSLANSLRKGNCQNRKGEVGADVRRRSRTGKHLVTLVPTIFGCFWPHLKILFA